MLHFTRCAMSAVQPQAIPFLYELRALLDWTCSATPLNWYQWLKLEDIRASLFVEECRWASMQDWTSLMLLVVQKEGYCGSDYWRVYGWLHLQMPPSRQEIAGVAADYAVAALFVAVAALTGRLLVLRGSLASVCQGT